MRRAARLNGRLAATLVVSTPLALVGGAPGSAAGEGSPCTRIVVDPGHDARANLGTERETVRALGSPDRGLQRRGDLTGFNWSDVPAILVEVGFLSNAREDRLLATRAYRRRAAEGMARGISRFVAPPRSRFHGFSGAP